MSYSIKEKKIIAYDLASVNQAAINTIYKFEGKIKETDSEKKEILATLPKKIFGNLLGDRTELSVKLSSNSASETEITTLIYPIDPVGRKLMFGARKGVSKTVLKWFFAHLDNQLSKI